MPRTRTGYWEGFREGFLAFLGLKMGYFGVKNGVIFWGIFGVKNRQKSSKKRKSGVPEVEVLNQFSILLVWGRGAPGGPGGAPGGPRGSRDPSEGVPEGVFFSYNNTIGPNLVSIDGTGC